MARPEHKLRSVLALALLAGLGGCTATSEADGDGESGEPPATVELGELRHGSLVVEHRLLGEVRSKAHAELAAGEPGEVIEVTVREGDDVERGDVLVGIDASLSHATVAAAAAQRRQAAEQLAQAERDAERMTGAGREAVAESEIEAAQARKAELEARKAELGAVMRERRARLARHRVLAPFAGQVASRSVDPGDWVSPGDPVLELIAVDDLEVLVEAPPELADKLSKGDAAVLRRGTQQAPARIEGLVRAISRETRTVKLRLVPTAEQAPEWLLPGGPVDAVFRITHENDGALLVSRDALVLGAVGQRVVRAVDGKAKPVDVEVVVASESEALVRGDGLEAGDQVVVRGNERLRPGQPLKAVERNSGEDGEGGEG